MSDAKLYNSSLLDWSALQSQAASAARQTPLKPAPAMGYVNRQTGECVQLLGPHWVLDHRMENYEERPNTAVIEEGHVDVIYALLPDGQLMYVRVSEDARVYTGGAQTTFTDNHSVRPMDGSDVQAFDFAKKYYEHGYGTDRHIWGDTDRAYDRGNLLHAVQGAGLSLLLHDIAEGRTTKLVPAGALAKFYDRAAQQSRQQAAQEAAQQRRLASEAASRKLAQASADWKKREARKAKMRRNDRIFDRVIGAFKGGAIGLVVWGILALTMGLNIGFGVLIMVLAIAGGARWLWRP